MSTKPTCRGGRSRIVGLICLILGGCESSFNHSVADAGAQIDASGAPGVQFAGTGIGSKCASDATCRSGLHCKSAICQATGVTANNGSCLLTAECGSGLHCGWAGFCTPQPGGAVLAGQACQKTGDCAGGLYCALVPGNTCASGGTCGVCRAPDANNVAPAGEECTSATACPPGMGCELLGLSGTCKPATGKGDLGVACSKSDDCLAGLACSSQQKKCVPGSLLLDPDLYPGVECDEDGEAAAPFQAVVRLPRPGTPTEFYALPFPNDILRKKGHIDVSGHPHPGLGLVGFDTVAAVQEALAQEMTGWGLTTGMYVRFTRAVNPASLLAGANGNVRLVNLKTGADVPINLRFETRRNKYICGNWLYAHTPWGTLLAPDTPYALIVNDAIALDKGEKGDPHPLPSADMALLLAEQSPSEAAVVDAWKLYAPVRGWLKTSGLSAKKVVAAALFTTWEPRSAMQHLADVALKTALPPGFSADGTPKVCGPGVHSPCQTPNWNAKLGPDPRDCPQQVNPAFVEIHAKLRLPYFQTGTRPYLKVGGALHLGADGKAALVDYESVCVAITLPKKSMPAAGWPLLVFAHGTGGSFRSAIDGVAGMVAGVSPVPGLPVPGGEAPYATLAIDQPMHANRRGEGIVADPGPLFYNFANPKAARGNFYQGAADNFSLYRLALATSQTSWTINGLPGTVKFDKANLVYMGHSQGGTTGPMFLPYMPGLKAAVLSGCGGSLVYGLLGKKKPYDASVGLRIALQDAQVNEFHPVLNLLQLYFEASDPLLYAPLLFKTPFANVGPINVLHTYGMNDSFTPVATSRIFAAATGGTLGRPGATAPPWFDPISDLAMAIAALEPNGISGNITTAGKKVTGVTIEATNDPKTSLFGNAYDGHFVAFNDRDTVRRVLTFLVTAVKGNPTVIK